jgi:membrane protease YdiL (CAAX protease family)
MWQAVRMAATHPSARFALPAEPLGAARGISGPAAAFAISVALGLGNDLLFNLVRGGLAIYLIGYALKATILLIAWRAVAAVPPMPARGDPWPVEQDMLLLCCAVGIGTSVMGVVLDPGWRLFEWPRIASPALRAFDLSAGLLLNAAAEELAFRRLALAVLPFAPRTNLVVSALIFGLIHWGAGLGSVLSGIACGLAFGYAYRRTGSLFTVILAHYVVNLALFV